MRDGQYTAARQKSLLREWNRFQGGGQVDRGIVRDLIYESWLRCRGLHLNPKQKHRRSLGHGEWEHVQNYEKRLIDAARDVLDPLSDYLGLYDNSLIFCDQDGIVLRAYNYGAAMQPFVYLGNIAREESSGTGSVALCLLSNENTIVFGAEHYMKAYHRYICNAMPVRNRYGKLIAVINVTQPYNHYHPHTTVLLKLAANSIADRIQLNELSRHQTILLDNLADAAIMLDHELNITGMNKKSHELFGISEYRSHIGINEFLSSFVASFTYIRDNSFADQDIMLVRGKTRHQYHMEFIKNTDSSSPGGLLILKPVEMKTGMPHSVESGHNPLENIKGSASLLQKAKSRAVSLAKGNLAILLRGENGVGKELFAKAIHAQSPRKTGPFITVDCGVFHKELVLAELFGYAPGAFTGACPRGRKGKLELADGGTVFLDEVGELPLETQSYLLRFLQEHEFTPLGDVAPKKVDVRILAATNRDLEAAVRAREFRADLYFRLNAATIHIPPLRECQENILPLAEYFLQICMKKYQKTKKLDEEAMRDLVSYAWPGNIRELENVMERAFWLSEDETITAETLGIPFISHTECINTPVAPESNEYELLVQALKLYHGNSLLVRKSLNMPKSTFYSKLKKYAIKPRDFILL